MSKSPHGAVSLRVQAAIYGAAMIYFGGSWMSAMIVPLYLKQLGVPNAEIGIVIGARAFLTLLLSIHGGALMDRLGTQRVMIGFAVLSIGTPLLFPVASWLPALIALQMVGGLADAMGWVGAQALSGTLMQGRPAYVGRMTFAARIAGFASPVLAGAVWDHLGVWATFITISLWFVFGLIATLALPAAASERPKQTGTPVRPGDLMPRLADYIAAFSLCAVPAIALVLFVTMIRVGGTGIQTSFYVVYLEGIQVAGAQIGLLLGVANFCASLSSLSLGPLARWVHPHWLVVVVVALTVLTIAVTPLLLGIYVLLMVVIGLRGVCLGISQPIEISILSRSLGADSQGKGVGLRTTANRISHTIVPPIMGFVADIFGIEESFFVMGGILLACIALTAWFVRRRPTLGRDG